MLGQLDWATFKALLPDLRRAFTQFIPSEIDRISARVGEEVGLVEPPARDAPVPAGVARVAAACPGGLPAASRRLVEMAAARGSADDISVVVIQLQRLLR